MESSKSAARHIKAVASDPQAAQVNLMRHQRTDLPTRKSKWKNIPTSKDQRVRKGTPMNKRIKYHPLRHLMQARHTKEEIDVQSVVTPSI